MVLNVLCSYIMSIYKIEERYVLMNNLTVVVLTKNEEFNIVDVVKNAKKVANDVLIVDSGSTDKTVELARANGARVVYREWDSDFSAQRNFAIKYVTTEWILYLDADERLNDTLILAITQALEDNKNKQFSIKRKSVAFGQEFNYGVLKPDYVPRLFRTCNVTWINKVHEKPICKDKLEVLNGYIKHYTYVSWKQWLVKFDQYTTIWAEDAYSKGKKATVLSAVGHAVAGFFHMAIVKKGVLDGVMGLIMCCNHFFYTMMKYLKLLELQGNGGKKI